MCFDRLTAAAIELPTIILEATNTKLINGFYAYLGNKSFWILYSSLLYPIDVYNIHPTL